MLTTDEARALVTTSLADDDLEDVIAREEAWLARRIGPLDGERTETFLSVTGAEALYLTRPTDVVSVEDENGARVDWTLRPWANVYLDDEAPVWAGSVVATYTPSDELEVKRALITLVRLTVHESAYQSQSAGGYSVASSVLDQRSIRWSTWRGLLRRQQPSSLLLRSPLYPSATQLASVERVAVAS